MAELEQPPGSLERQQDGGAAARFDSSKAMGAPAYTNARPGHRRAAFSDKTGIARIGDIMTNQVLRDSEGREVVRVATASGVVGYIATCASPTLLADMASKLRWKLARSQRNVLDPELRASIACALDRSRR